MYEWFWEHNLPNSIPYFTFYLKNIYPLLFTILEFNMNSNPIIDDFTSVLLENRIPEKTNHSINDPLFTI